MQIAMYFDKPEIFDMLYREGARLRADPESVTLFI